MAVIPITQHRTNSVVSSIYQQMTRFLRRAAAQGIAPQYVAKLLAAFGEPAQLMVPAAQALVEPLSERELEVLGLLAQGLSNREIAERLLVTVGTVKSHVHNIYGKLGVGNRTQAVARARALQLVSA